MPSSGQDRYNFQFFPVHGGTVGQDGYSYATIVTVTDKGTGGQPACPEEWKKCKKNMNSSNYVMYMSVCPVSYIDVVMFTCTLVRSPPDSRRR